MVRMNKATRRSRRASDGFTLVELLVALSLLLLIASMTLGSFSFGRRVWETSIERDRAAEARAAILLLRRHLMAAIPVAERRSDGSPRVAFRGTSEGLEYVASESGDTLPPGLYRVSVGVEPDAATGILSLTLAIAPLRGEEALPSADRLQRRTLATGLAELRFRYFGAGGPDETEGWSDDWAARPRPPRLVEIGYRGAGARATDALVVPLRIAR
jgi:prepilin-type N-terminal cleavage/methylation domain-containing protein